MTDRPGGGRRPAGRANQWACDTSVAVAALDSSHDAHAPARHALVEHRPALAGHAAFETYSVLTRLPVPLRVSPDNAAQILRRAFPDDCWLGEKETARLRDELASSRLVGGAVYDALVGRAAAVNGRMLLTRDRRAERTYRALDVPYELIG